MVRIIPVYVTWPSLNLRLPLPWRLVNSEDGRNFPLEDEEIFELLSMYFKRSLSYNNSLTSPSSKHVNDMHCSWTSEDIDPSTYWGPLFQLPSMYAL